MIRTQVVNKIIDSGASPYIEQKDVILCRSGIQEYHYTELEGFINEDNKPPKEKTWYREYRPANVVVKAKKLCSSLPVTKEHPSEWVTPDNFSELAGGTTDKEVEVVALDGESEGEIGLKSNITFYTDELHQYYEDNNREVSLGYTCTKHFVDNPEEVGYDIILDEITEVNHLAITKRGRGGSSVSVIDSIIGGMKPMRTGIWSFLKSKKQKDSAPASFGTQVFDALEKSKGTTEEELAADMKSVLDSCSELKDCEQKDTLINVVEDVFDNKEKAMANKEELTATLDSMYVSISGDSFKEIADAFKSVDVKPTAAADSEAEAKDSDKEDKEEKKDPEDKTDDSEKKDPEDKKEEEKDGCGAKDKCGAKDAASKDSLEEVVAKAVAEAFKSDAVRDSINAMVKDSLGIKEDKKNPVKGSELDSKNIDYEGELDDSTYGSLLM